MIDLHCLATAINDILGDKYVVWLNTNAEPDESETRTVVTMSAARIPFAYTTEELDAESLTLTLTFDLPVAAAGADLITRDIALNDIHNLLIGWRKIEVEQPSDNPNVPDRYAVTVRFEQQAPANPYTDTGHVKQQIVIGGTALAQNVNCKALVGNFVVVSINDTPLLKVSRVSNTQVGADNNLLLSEQKTLPEMHGISRISTKTLTFLYLGNDIEDEFLKIAEGVDHDVNKIYTYAVSYPNFTLSQKFKIAGVSSQDSAGVYLQYTLNVQLVEPAYVVEPPEEEPGGGDGGDSGDGGGDNTGGGEGEGGDGDDTDEPITTPEPIAFLTTSEGESVGYWYVITPEDDRTGTIYEDEYYKNLTIYFLTNTTYGDGAGALIESNAAYVIPANATYLGEKSFVFMTSPFVIDFAGTLEQWNALEKHDNWVMHLIGNQGAVPLVVRCTGGDTIEFSEPITVIPITATRAEE